MKKRKRMNQLAALERKKNDENSGAIGINDCDLGASPLLNARSVLVPPQKKNIQTGKQSPLMKAREFTLGKQ